MSKMERAVASGPRLGLVTIGQAPRTDLTPDVAEVLEGVEWVEHGALDALSRQEIAALAPRGEERELVSRLRDGSSARLGAVSIADHLDRAIAECVADSCSVVLVLCTGQVQHAVASVPVLHAEDLAHQEMTRVLGTGTLGVVCPLPEQLSDIEARWSERLNRPVVTTAANPYSSCTEGIDAAGGRLANANVDQIFLDCIGYTEQHASRVAAFGVETHTARGLAVRAAVKLLVASTT